MSTYSSILKRCPILTTSAFLFAGLAPLGCKLINVKTVGVPGLDDSPVEATNTAPAPASAPAPAPNPEQSRIDFVQKFAPALGAKARYSAAVAHGMPTACEKNERVVSMLWDFELSAAREDPTSNGYLSLACFPIHGKSIAWVAAMSDLYDVQQSGNLDQLFTNVLIDDDDYVMDPTENGLVTVLPGDESVVVLFPWRYKPLLNKNAAVERFDDAVDPGKAIVDILTVDAARAAAVDIEALRGDIVAKATDAVRKRSAALRGAAADALAKVPFPKSVSNDPTLVNLTRAHMLQPNVKSNFRIAEIKKIVVTTADWAIRTNEFGLIIGKTKDVVVGYQRIDNTCAYYGVVYQRDYAGGATYAATAHLTNLFVPMKELLCSNIK